MTLRDASSLLIAAAALALAGCRRTPATLPDAATLPLGPNQYCGCARDGECAVLEQVPGYSQVRNLSCTWIEPGEIAHCRFESRVVVTGEAFAPAGHTRVLEPIDGPWEAGTMRARLLSDGVWCREQN